MIGLLVAAQLAAGGVVDVGIGAEARAAQAGLIETVDLDPAVASGSLVLRPLVTGALENGVVGATAGYAPTLSLVSPLSDAAASSFTLLHVAHLGGDLRLGNRLSFRGTVEGSYGDLDPVTAQALFQGSNGARGLEPTPFAALGSRLGASAVLARRLTFDIDGNLAITTAFDTAGAPGVGVDAQLDIPLTIAPAVDATLAWQVSRLDSLLLGAAAQAASVAGRGYFFGGGPLVGWRRQLWRETGFDLTAGVGSYSASDDQLSPILVYIPTAQGRISTLLDLSGDAALEAGARAGFSVVNDPLSTLIENRASIGVSAGLRATRDVAVRGALSAAAPAFAYAQRGATSSATYGAELLVAWAPTDVVEVGGGFIGTTRIFEDRPVSDVQLAISLTARTPVLHTGGRPAGSGGGTTGSIGVTRIGTRERLGTTTIEEEEPLPPIEEEPAALVPPPGVLSVDPIADEAAPEGSKLRPLTEQEKRELERKKKKEKKEEEAAEGAKDEAEKGDDEKGDDKDKKEEPKEEAKPEG